MHALVIGLGVSGKAAALLLKQKGYAVTGVDAKPKEIEGIRVLPEGAVQDVKDFDLIVLSPGIAIAHPLYLAAKQENKNIVGEAQLAFRYLDQCAVGITGTNGKTTVTLLVEHVLKASGRKAKAVGNVGLALCDYAMHPDPEEILVVELSSFQLETMEGPFFDAVVVLNITPDHLDRHVSMAEYAAAKMQIGRCRKAGAPLYIHSKIAAEWGVSGDRFDLAYILPVGYRQWGKHDLENAQAAWVLCEEIGISREEFIAAADSFEKPHHRIAFVKNIEGVSYYDDSKGTNLDAVIQAVSMMEGPVILIAGGVDKGASYVPWKECFRGRVKGIIAIGQAAEKIQRELCDEFIVEIVDSLAAAVEKAEQKGNPGDVVLLSPGCSSYDMFRDYAHRGEEFQRCVNNIEEKRRIEK